MSDLQIETRTHARADTPYQEDLVQLAGFMINQIAIRPENRKYGAVNWMYVVGDVYLMYPYHFNDELIIHAIVLIKMMSQSFANQRQVTLH